MSKGRLCARGGVRLICVGVFDGKCLVWLQLQHSSNPGLVELPMEVGLAAADGDVAAWAPEVGGRNGFPPLEKNELPSHYLTLLIWKVEPFFIFISIVHLSR